MILVWVAVFAVHGFLRGSVAQVFVVLGLAVGLWAALGTARWLESYWRGAQPVWVYAALLWIVAALAGMAVASVIQWCGGRVGQTVQKGPMAWLDRGIGVGVGAAIGLFVAAFALMAALLVPWPRTVAGQIARSRAASPLMAETARACSVSGRFLPASSWLSDRFRQAHRRAERERARETRRTHES